MSTERIVIDASAKSLADHVWMSEQPHPKGRSLTQSLRLRRALWAYQWVRQNVEEGASNYGYSLMPSAQATLEALLEWESSDG